ncbi:Dipeptidyl peptidase IV (DPP IV) N-terminal region [Kordiimonas lacus]|uniref:Dipeptidyl peptidase IV (DPP IV) N-terminal region n=1 Tax=Kordiimonas lacus TaxID=637679 RepID=A0A1G6ZJ31_9PROT|nr:Dipeptidyl peptidase IV (DPP IV) N-terminal region [Kordiimonas lacus]
MSAPLKPLFRGLVLAASAGLLIAAAAIDTPGAPTAPRQLTAADYDRARDALPQNMAKLVKNARIDVHWAKDGNLFWYKRDTADGHEFILVDPAFRLQTPLFDHTALAAKLGALSDEPVTATDIGVAISKLASDGRSLEFSWQDKRFSLDRETGTLTELEDDTPEPGTSPDGKHRVLRVDHNLVLRNLETGADQPLTSDGAACNGYGEPMPTPSELLAPPEGDMAADVYWAPDSSRFVTYRIDCRTTGTLTLVESTPERAARPRAVTYPYPLSLDENVPMATLYVGTVADGSLVKSDLPAFPELYYGGPWLGWMDDSQSAYIRVPARGYKSLKLIELDGATAKHRVLIDETADDFVDYYAHRWDPVVETGEHFWMSNRGGWAHLVRYDPATGKTNPVTSGDWRFRYIARAGDAGEPLHIFAAGREKGRDPYLRHLYRVNRDGSGLTLLTPEPADHGASVSPDGNYIVDNMSRADLPTKTVLRDGASGEILMTLEEADVRGLNAAGIPLPEPFKAKAADGKTDIYGVIYRPAGFDPSKAYPVIDNVYRGPHYVMAKKSFDRATRNTAISMAQLGFVVIQVDGRGTNKRSHAFLKAAQNNLGPAGFDDHIATMKQLQDRFGYLDLDRVGIYGFSAGGYDAMRALIEHPEFYKVAVAASGNHDHRLDKAVWNEQWMGAEGGAHYDANSNLFGLERLQGKLMLAHGEMDDNVNPIATMQLVGALIEANKDFDLLIVPGAGHFLDDVPYFQRRRWDFFTRHLMGATPPENYKLEVSGPTF